MALTQRRPATPVTSAVLPPPSPGTPPCTSCPAMHALGAAGRHDVPQRRPGARAGRRRLAAVWVQPVSRGSGVWGQQQRHRQPLGVHRFRGPRGRADDAHIPVHTSVCLRVRGRGFRRFPGRQGLAQPRLTSAWRRVAPSGNRTSPAAAGTQRNAAALVRHTASCVCVCVHVLLRGRRLSSRQSSSKELGPPAIGGGAAAGAGRPGALSTGRASSARGRDSVD